MSGQEIQEQDVILKYCFKNGNKLYIKHFCTDSFKEFLAKYNIPFSKIDSQEKYNRNLHKINILKKRLFNNTEVFHTNINELTNMIYKRKKLSTNIFFLKIKQKIPMKIVIRDSDRILCVINFIRNMRLR